RQAVHPGDPDQRPDRELLRAWVAEGSEAAFASLVRRHGATVWNVCRRVLRHHQDAEDAFQATFLVLARRAASVPWGETIAPWLSAVARGVAAGARSRPARPPAAPREEAAGPDPLEEMTGRELLAVLDQEVAALPPAYRGPVVLCLLEGRTQEDATRLLGASL